MVSLHLHFDGYHAMATLFGILQTGARGLFAAQVGLNTTGNNIANAKTDGYSRQRVVQTSANPLITPYGALGQGVDVATVQRVRDNFIERQIRNSQSDSSFFSKQNEIFNEIAAILNDPLTPISESADANTAGGLNNLLANFYAAWNELQSNPEAAEVRSSVIEAGVTLAETFSQVDEDLLVLRQDLDNRIATRVNEINNLANDLVRINQRIAVAEVGQNVTANDLRDQRDTILRKLSEIIPIESSTDETGQVSVTLLGNRLVDRQVVNVLEVRPGIADGQDILNVFFARQGITALDPDLNSGELGALVDARDNLVTNLLDDIDTLARSVILEVNRLHCASTGLDGFKELKTNIALPSGSSVAGSNITLDRIFNNPRLQANSTTADIPYAIHNGEFTIRIANKDGDTRQSFNIAVQTTDNLEALRERIDRADGIVSQVFSGASFDPVFTSDVTSQLTLNATDVQGAGALTLANLFPDLPIADTTGTFSLDVVVRDIKGADVSTFTVTIDPNGTMQDFLQAFNNPANGSRVIASLDSEGQAAGQFGLRFTASQLGETFSIRQDSSGIVQALKVPITDPTAKLVAGVSSREDITIAAGQANTSFIGPNNPNFSAVFPGLGVSGSGPSVIGEGNFELVAVDVLGNIIAAQTITLSDGGIDTLAEIRDEINNFWTGGQNSEITASIDAVNNLLTLDTNLGARFMFQNDETGIVKALGLDRLNGHGELNGQAFQSGEFEVVVANRDGTVTDIFNVNIAADAGGSGVVSLDDIVTRFNNAAASVGAPLSAVITTDPQTLGVNRIKFVATENHQFTFRSDDSRLLAALGLHRGPALNESLQAPIENAANVIRVGDNIGPTIKAEFDDTGQIRILTTGDDRITFTNDSSDFLAAAGINTFFQGTDAGTMKVSDFLRENGRYLAVSKTGLAGDNQTALDISSLQFANVIDGGSHEDYYRSIISALGIKGARVSQFLDTNNKILTEFKNLQEQQTGVSLDEESINLIQFQQAFTASARMISVIDQMLDVVINGLG